MPGTTVAINPKGVVSEEIVSSVLFDGRYDKTLHHRADDSVVFDTSYGAYPVKSASQGTTTVVMEGRSYSTPTDNVLDTALRLAGEGSIGDLTVEIDGVDGDFLLVTVDSATDEVHVWTDTFRRLPTFLATVDDSVVLSREAKLVRKFLEEHGDARGFDPLGVAQTVLFGYQLGTRTIYDGIANIPPGSHISITDEVRIEQYTGVSLSNEHHNGRSLEENATELVDRFLDACSRYATSCQRNVVWLSGGLDSRAVAAGYAQVDGTPTTVTHGGGKPKDFEIARRIADELDLEWEGYRSDGQRDFERILLDQKQGLNSLRMATVLEVLEQTRADFGDYTRVSGDGGDKIFPDLTPVASGSTVDDLVDAVIEYEGRVSVADATELAGVSHHLLRDSIRERFESYPEEHFDEKYVRFLVRERGQNWLFHGEDRARYSVWTVSPFFSLPLFTYAMQCPWRQKRHDRLYVAFQEKLSPTLVTIENANFGAPPESREYRVKMRGLHFLARYPGLRSRVSSIVYGDESSEIASRIQEDLTSTSLHLPTGPARRISETDTYSESALYDLHTLLAVDRMLGGERAALQPTGTGE